jgi:hypothetical protein
MVADVSTCEASIARDRLADVLACIALVLLCLMPFWPVFLGAVLVPFEGLYLADRAFGPFRPPHVTWPMRFTGDLVFQMYPWRLFTTDGLAAGYIPLWNPYAGCGQSFIGNNQSALCNPTNLLLNLFLPAATGQTVFSLLTLIGACLFTYALTRSLRGPPIGAFLAAFTYGFGGFMFVWLGFPLAAAAMWLPALLLATHRLALRPTAVRAVLVSITIGWQLVSGHLGASAQTLAFWGVFLCCEWTIYRHRRDVGWARDFVGFAALALLLGAGLAMPQLLPLRESFGLSSMSSSGRSRFTSGVPAEEVGKALLWRRLRCWSYRNATGMTLSGTTVNIEDMETTGNDPATSASSASSPSPSASYYALARAMAVSSSGPALSCSASCSTFPFSTAPRICPFFATRIPDE